MFVLEDPGRRRSVRERELRDSNVKSYLAIRRHYRQRQVVRRPSSIKTSSAFPTSFDNGKHGRGKGQIAYPATTNALRTLHHAANLCHPMTSHPAQDEFADHHNDAWSHLPLSPRYLSPVSCDETFEEARGIQFFIERTATDWSGWYDSHFWAVIALQVSTLLPCVRHGLVSIAAVHEALEIQDQRSSLKQKAWALQQGKKSLSCLSQTYSEMSLSSILVVHILISAFTLFQHEPSSFDAMRVMYDLDERIQRSMTAASSIMPQADRSFITNYLHPLVERHKSKYGQMVDLIWCLRTTDASHFATTDRPIVPPSFTSLDHARSTLDELLRWAAYTAKSRNLPPNTIPAAAEADLAKWLSALRELQKGRKPSGQYSQIWTERDRCNINILRLVAHIFFMMIRVVGCESEMVFDQYTYLYKDIARVYRNIISYRKNLSRTNFSISTEASFLIFIGNAVCRWCRDPPTRQELIELLLESNGRETHESAFIWAETARCLKAVEERATSTSTPPKTAADIPETARVRFDAIFSYMRQGIASIRYLHYPFREDVDAATVCILRPGCGAYLPWEADVVEPQDKADFIFARGYSSWLSQTSGSDSEYYTVKEPNFYFNIPKL